VVPSQKQEEIKPPEGQRVFIHEPKSLDSLTLGRYNVGKCWNQGAKMMQSSKRGVFLNPLSMLLAGLILGVAARVFDIYFQILREIFSHTDS
jgi:hypothetical protein